MDGLGCRDETSKLECTSRSSRDQRVREREGERSKRRCLSHACCMQQRRQHCTCHLSPGVNGVGPTEFALCPRRYTPTTPPPSSCRSLSLILLVPLSPLPSVLFVSLCSLLAVNIFMLKTYLFAFYAWIDLSSSFWTCSPHIYCSLSHVVVASRVLIPFPTITNGYTRRIRDKIIIFTCE